jgi:hypothetical protein
MNTTPDEELLALWVDDALEGTPAAEVEAWAASRPEWLERREQARQVGPLLRAGLPAVEEPPYAEFFNARIARELARESGAGAVAPSFGAPGRFRRWFLPATAVAGMMLCFWAGTRISPAPVVVAPDPVAAPPAPYLYTPEKGVKAAYFASQPAEAMVIVLDGVAAIPDSFEIPDTASVVREPDAATAEIDTAAP